MQGPQKRMEEPKKKKKQQQPFSFDSWRLPKAKEPEEEEEN